MKAIILAAGKGGNLLPFSQTRPIPLVSVAGTDVFDNTIGLLKNSGINDIFAVVGHQKEKVIERIGEHSHNGLNIHYLEQKKLGEIGVAVSQAKSKISPGEYFMLVYGDIVASSNIFSKVQQSFHSFKSAVASICLPPSNEMFGNVFLNAQMKITQIIEKPKNNDLGNYVLAGVYILPSKFFEILEKNRYSMEKSIREMAEKEGLWASMWEDEWLDIVYPWEILTANQILMNSWEASLISSSATLEGNVTMQGPVRIEDNVVVKAGAVLEGPCSIGKGSYIGNNSLIRSYTSLGEGCSVGYGVEMKNCVVFKNSRIGRLSFIGDSVLGEGVDVGAGSMTVNRSTDWSPVEVKLGRKNFKTGRTKLGAFVGDGVIIGAGNTIEPGTIIAPRKSLPAQYTIIR
jgi:UDP-N-acetylglucosamine diphosphorylase / glucose-1-phosphate thymidylyltransferase / UDP-N-acetylgalactosamine diphosphorylase / glucosamine-1-phosphate N-acetyltransferase / galactosamine-1-phosphate N-acetyltransferase